MDYDNISLFLVLNIKIFIADNYKTFNLYFTDTFGRKQIVDFLFGWTISSLIPDIYKTFHLKAQFTQNKNLVIIYSPSICSRSV